MISQNISLWASHNLLVIAVICFVGATLMLISYSYTQDYAHLDKRQ